MSQPRNKIALGGPISPLSGGHNKNIQDVIHAGSRVANKFVQNNDNKRGKGELSIFSNDYARGSLPEHRQVKGQSDLRYHNEMNGQNMSNLLYDQKQRQNRAKQKRTSMLPPVLGKISETPRASGLLNVYDAMTLEDVRQHTKEEKFKILEYKK